MKYTLFGSQYTKKCKGLWISLKRFKFKTSTSIAWSHFRIMASILPIFFCFANSELIRTKLKVWWKFFSKLYWRPKAPNKALSLPQQLAVRAHSPQELLVMYIEFIPSLTRSRCKFLPVSVGDSKGEVTAMVRVALWSLVGVPVIHYITI